MNKIIISIPTKKEKFKLSYGKSRGKHFSTIGRLKKSILKLALASRLKEKTAVIVKNGSGILNESLASTDKKYLKLVLNAFLEEYSGKSASLNQF